MLPQKSNIVIGLRSLSLALLLVLAAMLPVQAQAKAPERLLLNVTTDSLERGAMALAFAQAALRERDAEVVVYLNVDGVRLANETAARRTFGDNQSLQQMLRDFMKYGGRVLACKLCLERVAGLNDSNLLKGIEVVEPHIVMTLLFRPNVAVLTY